MIKLGICIPHQGSIKMKTVLSLMRIMKLAMKTLPAPPIYIEKEGSILHWNREELAKKAIELECTHMLFVDTDIVFPEDALMRLLERDKDIIGVSYRLKKEPPVTTLKTQAEEGKIIKEAYPDGLLKCAAVATGFMLIKTEVFKKISHPWFFWKMDETGDVIEGEDFWFCRKAREAGFDIWADLTVDVGHIGDKIF